MRRVGGYALITLGLIGLFMSPLARFYVAPRVKKIPTDFYFREVSEGTGTYLNPGAGFEVVGPTPVMNVTIQRGVPSDSTEDVAAWDQLTSLFDPGNHHQITYDIDRLTLRRTDAVGVDCCGENEGRVGTLTALFPIGTKKTTYRFWDFNAKRAFDISYQETTTVDGLTAYRFHQHIDPLQISQLKLPGRLVGLPAEALVELSWWYASDTDIWVEPVTGGILKASQKADQWLEDPAGVRRLTVALIEAGWNDDTVRRAVHDASQQRSQLQLISFGIPVFGPIVGIVFILAGLFLAGGGRRRALPDEEDRPPA